MSGQAIEISQTHIDNLFNSAYFINKFKQLQVQTYNDHPQIQSALSTKTIQQSNTKQNNNQNNSGVKNNKIIHVEEVIGQISQLMMDNFKELMYKETNVIYDNKLNLMALTEEIQVIKQSISKMSQASSFVISAKTLTTHESITPDKYQIKPANKQKDQIKEKINGKQGETSMFMDEDEQSSIDLGCSRKNLTEDRLGGFSFMNSFLNENKISSHEEEIINQRINASISKVQSSIDDRINQLEKEFTRRIEQVMKTIGHLLQMMSQNQRDFQSPFKKNLKKDTIKNSLITPIQNQPKKIDQIPKNTRNVSSKSTIILPNTKKQQKEQKIGEKPNIDNLEVDLTKSQLQKQIIKSSSKLASFFGIGKNNTSEK